MLTHAAPKRAKQIIIVYQSVYETNKNIETN